MPKIEIEPEFCKGCMYCAETCPKKVIGTTSAVNSKGYQYAVPLHPENCIGCTLCAVICPDAAIEVYKEE
ncbi:MAG: ferredoxin family protein [Clostridiales bacterium]|nr:ferredoxin family protein [Clostridiales bacterium]